MEKFEYTAYRSNNLPLFGNGHEDEIKLNEYGAKGWDLVWVEVTQPVTINLFFFSTTKAHKERVFYFRRKIENETT